MNESHGYTLRRSNSPYRGRKLSSSPRTKRRKSKISSDEQMIFDAVHVATYNDSPQHMYGLDKNAEEDLVQTQSISNTNDQKGKIFQGIKCRLLQLSWHLITIYFVFAVIMLEGCKRMLYTNTTNTNKQVIMNDSQSHEAIQRLIDQISAQKLHIEEFSMTIKQLQQRQQPNCSCRENIELLNEDKTRKGAVESMQQQILTTIDLVKSLNDRMTTLQQAVRKQEEINKEHENKLCQGEDCHFFPRNIFATIQSALETYHADVLGLTDFALETAGGSIHNSFHSDTCEVGAPIIKVFGLSLWQDPRSPRTVIRSDKAAGKCWPMKGTSGFIVIKLATQVHVTTVSLEHLDQRLDKYSNDMYQSAPKDFEVYAWLDKEGRMKVKLGGYVYVRDQSPIQTFKIQAKVSKPIGYIELRILSNYGNKDCTCLYRFRVHGTSQEWDGL